MTTQRAAGRLVPRSASFIGSVSLAGRIVDRLAALGQILLIAAVFGATTDADLYFIASIVPIMIGGILGEALYVSILPTLALRGQEGSMAEVARAGFWLSAAVLTAATLAYVAVVAVVVPFAHPAGNDSLAPWLAFTPIAPLLGLGTYAAAVLLELERYVWPPFRTAAAALVGLCLSGVALAVTEEVVWVGVAVSTGYAVALALLLVEIVVVGGREMLGRPTRAALAGVLRLRGRVGLSLAGGLLGGQMFVFLERFLAASLGVGAVAAISYSRGIAFTPIVVAQSIAFGLYPGMLRAHAGRNLAYLRGSFLAGLRVTLFLALGTALYLALFSGPIARLVFERGDLGGSAIAEIDRTLQAFSLAIVGTMLLVYTARVFSAIDFFRAIVWTQGAALAVYVALALPLRPALGPSGLALAFGIAEVTGAALALVVAARRLGLDWGTLFGRVFQPLAWRAAILAVALVAGRWALEERGVDSNLALVLGGLAVGSVVGVALLWRAPWEELEGARALIRRVALRR